MGSFAGLLVAITMACSAAFVVPRVHVRPLGAVRLAAPSDGSTIDSARVIRLGGGTEMMVAKRRRRSSEEESPETEAQATTRVVEQTAPVTNKLEQRLRFAEENAIPIAVGAFLVFKKITTGSWLEWGMSRFDNSKSRRTSVQSEEDLGKINMMSCEKCGFTIFPALGRTLRFDTYTKKCQNCGAVGSFYDKNDPKDERNLNPDGTSKLTRGAPT